MASKIPGVTHRDSFERVWAEAAPLLTAPLSGHQVVINGHALCPPFFIARGRDLRRRFAVQMQRSQRSEDEGPVPGTSKRIQGDFPIDVFDTGTIA